MATTPPACLCSKGDKKMSQVGNLSGFSWGRSKRVFRVLIFCTSWIVVPVYAIPVNVALESNGSVAVQSSTIGSPGSDGQLQVASRAIDGDTNGDWYSGRITHTNSELQPWWEVTFGSGPVIVNEIDVWNRTDCCVDRLDHFDLLLLHSGQVVWSSLHNPYTRASPEASFLLEPLTVGDTVRVQLAGGNYLSLAEVQVWSETTSVPEPSTLALSALGLVALKVRRYFHA